MRLTLLVACILVAPAVVPVEDAEARRSSRAKSVRASGGNGGAAYGAFRNCAAARAAGAAPVYRGQPGFGPHLDADGDGIGCEPYRGRRR